MPRPELASLLDNYAVPSGRGASVCGTPTSPNRSRGSSVRSSRWTSTKGSTSSSSNSTASACAMSTRSSESPSPARSRKTPPKSFRTPARAERAFERVFRRTAADRAFETVKGFEGLSPETLEAINALELAYLSELEAVNKRPDRPHEEGGAEGPGSPGGALRRVHDRQLLAARGGSASPRPWRATRGGRSLRGAARREVLSPEQAHGMPSNDRRSLGGGFENLPDGMRRASSSVPIRTATARSIRMRRRPPATCSVVAAAAAMVGGETATRRSSDRGPVGLRRSADEGGAGNRSGCLLAPTRSREENSGVLQVPLAEAAPDGDDRLALVLRPRRHRRRRRRSLRS